MMSLLTELRLFVFGDVTNMPALWALNPCQFVKFVSKICVSSAAENSNAPWPVRLSVRGVGVVRGLTAFFCPVAGIASIFWKAGRQGLPLRRGKTHFIAKPQQMGLAPAKVDVGLASVGAGVVPLDA